MRIFVESRVEQSELVRHLKKDEEVVVLHQDRYFVAKMVVLDDYNVEGPKGTILEGLSIPKYSARFEILKELKEDGSKKD
jgi:hypothetical protein